MSFAESCLDEREWRTALAESVDWHKAETEKCMRSGIAAPQADPTLEARAGKWLLQVAAIDPGYAVWASHHYRKLGASEVVEEPLFKDFPSRLARRRGVAEDQLETPKANSLRKLYAVRHN